MLAPWLFVQPTQDRVSVSQVGREALLHTGLPPVLRDPWAFWGAGSHREEQGESMEESKKGSQVSAGREAQQGRQ